MLISHKYKFIFIKTTKTAGTSLEVDLGQIMGEDDIVTPILPVVAGHRPRNFRIESSPGILSEAKYFNHISAIEVRALLGAELFDSYFKFCVEREPLDKCVSHFSMIKNNPASEAQARSLTWDEYVQRGNFPTDHAKYTDGQGALAVDRILRYECLNRDMRAVAEELAFEFTAVKARAKSRWRMEVQATEEQRRRIYDGFRETLRYVDYPRSTVGS